MSLLLGASWSNLANHMNPSIAESKLALKIKKRPSSNKNDEAKFETSEPLFILG
jgi:hypothetical protein